MVTYIFGITPFAEMVQSYIPTNEFGGYIVDKQYMPSLDRRDIIAWEDFDLNVSSNSCQIIVAVGYNDMNFGRKKVFEKIKNAGFSVCNFVHPTAIISNNTEIGTGNIFLENCVIQPFAKIGDCNIFWCNSTICHHSIIGNFNFFAASSVVLGKTIIGNQCFVGSNATIKNRLLVSDKTLIGAGAFLHTSTEEGDVYVPVRSIKLDKKSEDIKL